MLSGAFIDYAFYRIMQTIRKSTRPGEPITPTMIYLEEFWFLIEVPAFRKKVRDWLKTLAKLNAFLVMTTQSLEDMVSSDAKFFASLRDNIPTKIFLPNAKAKTEKLYNLYTREFGLDDGYVDLIQKGIPKRDYLVVTDEYAKQIICQFGESSLAVLRSDTKAQAVFDEHYLKTPDWKKRYIYEVIGEVLPEETTEQQPGEAA
jgi:type IV secretion system protein VirB4